MMKITKNLNEARIALEKVIGNKLLLVNSGIISESLKDGTKFLNEFSQNLELYKELFLLEALSRKEKDDYRKIYKSALEIAEVSPQPFIDFVSSFDMSAARKFWTPSAVEPQREFGQKRIATVTRSRHEDGSPFNVDEVDLDTASFEKDFLRATAQLTKFIALAKGIADILEEDSASEGVKKKSFWNKMTGPTAMEKRIAQLVQDAKLPFNGKRIAEEFSTVDLSGRQMFINAVKGAAGVSVVNDISTSFMDQKPSGWMGKLRDKVGAFGDKLTSTLDTFLPGGSHRPMPQVSPGFSF